MNNTLPHELTEQWQASSRLRWGVGLVAIILALYGLLLLSDFRHTRAEEYLASSTRLQTLMAAKDDRDWPQYSQQIQSLLVKWQSILWSVESKGLAQAELQSWLNKLFARLQLEHVTFDVTAARRVNDYSSVWAVSAEIEGGLQLGELLELLNSVENHAKLLRFEQVSLRRAGNGYRLKTLLTAYFVVAAES